MNPPVLKPIVIDYLFMSFYTVKYFTHARKVRPDDLIGLGINLNKNS